MAPIIDAIRDAIVKAVAPRRIIVFGSHANGTETPDSDVDVLIIVDTDRPTYEVRVDARLSMRGFHVPMDLIVLTPAQLEAELEWPSSVISDAVKTGRVIYEAPA